MTSTSGLARLTSSRLLNQFLFAFNRRMTSLTFSAAAKKPIDTNDDKGIEHETPIIPLQEAERFVADCMKAVGAPEEHAQALATLLILADHRGHFSHGMNRLEMYVNDVLTGVTKPRATPTILKESPATAWIDGNNGLGAVVGRFCMEVAIKKAKEVGVGVVTCKGSNHYGIAGAYALQAIEQDLLGMSFTNASPLMTPTRGTQSCLGTNPIALGAPSTGDDFVLDMATSAVALGKIEIQKRKGQPIPEGWALNNEGKVETDAHVAYKAAKLMPLGGSELHSGYKGYGLGMLVEILCGVLGGGNFGLKIRSWGSTEEIANLGQCFIAIDPNCFAPDFKSRLDQLTTDIKSTKPVDEDKPILIAGDPERAHMKKVAEQGGVQYVEDQMKTCAKLSKQLKIPPIKGLGQ